jgi:hypothetical protein
MILKLLRIFDTKRPALPEESSSIAHIYPPALDSPQLPQKVPLLPGSFGEEAFQKKAPAPMSGIILQEPQKTHDHSRKEGHKQQDKIPN